MCLAVERVPRVNRLRILFATVGLLLCNPASPAYGQPLKARITVVALSPARLLVEAESLPRDTWSFRNVYAGIIDLGERIENFHSVGAQGESVSVSKLASGEFRSHKKVSKFSYEVSAGEPARLGQMSHVSWLNQERGFLMLADLLPLRSDDKLESSSAVIEFKLPAVWTVASTLRANAGQQYAVPKVETAVFYVGRSLREERVRVDSMELTLITSGEWAFADTEALKLVSKVVKQYSKLTKYRLPSRSVVMLSPFPGSVGPARWTAETRGESVVLLLGRNASRRALLARLGVLFTHELFHLWVPNALALNGDYDWFFEGFTLYQALLTALRLDFITFEDYLDTIARVYDSYRALPDRDSLSLIEASERRWTSSPSFIYDKGMLVAFIYDLRLRQSSRNQASLPDIYPRLFPPAAGRENANEVIISILNSPAGMRQFADPYVSRPFEIDLPALLAPYGLRVETTNSQTRIAAEKGLSLQQLSLLRSLDYKR